MGVHRGGTSLVANCLHELGVYLGEPHEMVAPGGDNPDGFYEHEAIVGLQEALLTRLAVPWYTVPILSDGFFASAAVCDFQAKLERLLKRTFGGHELWGWKDPRTTLLWPAWLPVLERLETDVVAIIALRHPAEVVASLQRRNGFSRDLACSIWCLHMLEAFRRTADRRRAVVAFDDLFIDPARALKSACRRVGILWPGDEEATSLLGNVVNPALRHTKGRNQDIGPGPLGEFTVSLYESLSRAASDGEILQSEQFHAQVEARFAEFRELAGAFRQAPIGSYGLQIYPRKLGEFDEQSSRWADVPYSSDYSAVTLRVPPSPDGVYRLDPTNEPAKIDIDMIDAWAVTPAGERRRVGHWINYSEADGMAAGPHTLVSGLAGMHFIAPTADPSVVLRTNHQGEIAEGDEVEFVISIKAWPLSEEIASVLRDIPSLLKLSLEMGSFERDIRHITFDLFSQLAADHAAVTALFRSTVDERRDVMEFWTARSADVDVRLQNALSDLTAKVEHVSNVAERTMTLVELLPTRRFARFLRRLVGGR